MTSKPSVVVAGIKAGNEPKFGKVGKAIDRAHLERMDEFLLESSRAHWRNNFVEAGLDNDENGNASLSGEELKRVAAT